jgi:DNA-binding NarL/FixJ family response regulator
MSTIGTEASGMAKHSSNGPETPPGGRGGWLLVPEGAVPDRWRDRAVPMMFVPLLPQEADQVLESGSARPELDAEDEALLRLLAKGSTVEDTARKMGLHIRTVERRLAALRRRLGVATTAELVRMLARRGF